MDVNEQTPIPSPTVPPLPPAQAPVVVASRRPAVVTLMATVLFVMAGQNISVFISIVVALSSSMGTMANPIYLWYMLGVPVAVMQLIAGACLLTSASWTRGTVFMLLALMALISIGRDLWQLLPYFGLSPIFSGGISTGSSGFGILAVLLRIATSMLFYGALFYFLSRREDAQ